MPMTPQEDESPDEALQRVVGDWDEKVNTSYRVTQRTAHRWWFVLIIVIIDLAFTLAFYLQYQQGQRDDATIGLLRQYNYANCVESNKDRVVILDKLWIPSFQTAEAVRGPVVTHDLIAEAEQAYEQRKC